MRPSCSAVGEERDMSRDHESRPMIGVDVGGVLVAHHPSTTDTSFFGARPMETPMVEGAIDGLRTLVQLFEGRVAIVSKAGTRIAGLTTRWLWANQVFQRTGLDPGLVHYVRTRPDKGPLCFTLGISHFIDDRQDVLDALRSVPNRYLFTGGRLAGAAPVRAPSRFVVVDSWPEVVARIRGSLDA